jgi:hypothetical protein
MSDFQHQQVRPLHYIIIAAAVNNAAADGARINFQRLCPKAM